MLYWCKSIFSVEIPENTTRLEIMLSTIVIAYKMWPFLPMLSSAMISSFWLFDSESEIREEQQH
jgi:hypothetical protein